MTQLLVTVVIVATTTALWMIFRNRTISAGPVIIVYGLVFLLGWGTFQQFRADAEQEAVRTCLLAVDGRDDQRRQWIDTYSVLYLDGVISADYFVRLTDRLNVNLPPYQRDSCPARIPIPVDQIPGVLLPADDELLLQPA